MGSSSTESKVTKWFLKQMASVVLGTKTGISIASGIAAVVNGAWAFTEHLSGPVALLIGVATWATLLWAFAALRQGIETLPERSRNRNEQRRRWRLVRDGEGIIRYINSESKWNESRTPSRATEQFWEHQVAGILQSMDRWVKRAKLSLKSAPIEYQLRLGSPPKFDPQSVEGVIGSRKSDLSESGIALLLFVNRVDEYRTILRQLSLDN